MGTENPRRPSFPARPAATPFAPTQTMSPFSSTGPVVGSEPPPFRPATPAASLTATPYLSSGPGAGSGAPSFRPTPPGRFNDPSIPPPPTSHVAPPGGPFQRFPTPQFSATAQAPPQRAPPMGQPSIQPSLSQPPSFSSSQYTQPQTPFVPMGSHPPSDTLPPSSLNVPRTISDSSFPAPRANFQPPIPGYTHKWTGTEMQTPPIQPYFPPNQGNYGPTPPAVSSSFLSHQGSYAPPPPVAAPLGMQPMQQPVSGPPIGAIQGLTEAFSSLSVQTRPGTMDVVIDAKELPRPLDVGVEPHSVADMYPMNSNPRYLRLTTSAIPSSQSLASRWQLPLGAVVCPLAEAPDGVSTSLPSLICSNTYCIYIVISLYLWLFFVLRKRCL